MNNSDTRCVCLDAEFVEGDELIELSIYSLGRTLLYHQLFRPQRYKRWDSSIHHITEEMVSDAPTFAAELPTVQRIIDEARYVIGFAVSNDTSHLQRQHVAGLDDKHIIELRDWFWIGHGRDAGLDLYQGVSLASVTEHLGVDFGEEGMHSASGDTLATLDCFLQLFDRYRRSRKLDDASFDEVVEAFDREYEREKFEYDRTHAEGYAWLLRCGEGYALRVRREEPRMSSRVVGPIRVADRNRAVVELGNMLKRRPSLGKGVYKITQADIEQFKAYKTEFDTDDHAFFKKLQGLSDRFNVSGLKKR